MIQSMMTTPVSVVNQMITKIQNGYPVEEFEVWEDVMIFLTEDMTESKLGGAGVDIWQFCHTGLHSKLIFAIEDDNHTLKVGGYMIKQGALETTTLCLGWNQTF